MNEVDGRDAGYMSRKVLTGVYWAPTHVHSFPKTIEATNF